MLTHSSSASVRSSRCPSEPVAVDGASAVVRLLVRYETPGRQEYRDLWLLRLAADGRVEDFEERAYFPGQPYTAAADRS